MSVAKLFEPLSLAHGPAMKNRLMLAPLTNEQSHPDGRLSEEEFRWLTLRAEGGFALTMTCAMHVQVVGQGFNGQLAIFGDQHLAGLSRLAGAIKARGSIAEPVDDERLFDDLPRPHSWIQRGIRILKHDLHVAARLAHSRPRESQDVFAVEAHAS